MSAPQLDQRKRVLTNEDVAKIGDAFDERMSSLFETIGYNVNSPDERAKIRADHIWVRDLRTGTDKLKSGAVLSIVTTALAGITYALWTGFKAVLAGMK